MRPANPSRRGPDGPRAGGRARRPRRMLQVTRARTTMYKAGPVISAHRHRLRKWACGRTVVAAAAQGRTASPGHRSQPRRPRAPSPAHPRRDQPGRYRRPRLRHEGAASQRQRRRCPQSAGREFAPHHKTDNATEGGTTGSRTIRILAPARPARPWSSRQVLGARPSRGLPRSTQRETHVGREHPAVGVHERAARGAWHLPGTGFPS